MVKREITKMMLKNKNLRYQISSWDQITQCKSNNSKNLSLSLVKLIRSYKIEGTILQVNHPEFGTLFAAMIDGNGELITENDENGYHILYSAEKSNAHFDKYYSLVKDAYLNHVIGKMINDTALDLLADVEYTDEFENLAYDSISMN